MRTLGLIVVPDRFDAETRVAGLPPLLRHALALQAAGVAEVLVIGGDAPLPAIERLVTPVRRVQESELPTDAVPHLVVAADVTCHRLLAARMAQMTVAAGEILAARSTSDAASACFFASPDKVADVLHSIRAGALPTIGVRDVPLELREFVLPARDVAERRAAMHLHLESLRKPTQGILDRTLMRPVSLRMTRALVGTRVMPNHVTLFCGLLALVSAWFVTWPGRWPLVVGGVLHIWVRVVDCVDGELARLRYEGTKFGEWLDTTVDTLGVAALLAAAAWRISSADSWWTPLGIFSVVSWLGAHALLFWAMAHVGAGTGQALGWSYREAPKSFVDRVVRRFEFLFQIDMISTVYALLVALDRIDVLMILQGVLGIVTTTYFGIQLANKPLAMRRNRPR